MKVKQFSCKNCGASIEVGVQIQTGRCEMCGSHYVVERQERVRVIHYAGHFRITALRVALFCLLVAAVIGTAVFLAILLSRPSDTSEPPRSAAFEDPLAYKFAGTYLAGEDIEAGEYEVWSDPTKEYGRAYIMLTPNAGPNTANCPYDYYVQRRTLVTVEDGQYLKITDANLYKIGTKPLTMAGDGYAEYQQLKAGRDIPVGEYAVCADDAYINFTVRFADGTPTNNMVLNGQYRFYVQLTEGDVIYTQKDAILYPFAKRPAIVKNTDGSYRPGQYRVGEDIPAGSYRLTANATYVIKIGMPFYYYADDRKATGDTLLLQETAEPVYFTAFSPFWAA